MTREEVIRGLEWCMNEKHDCYREKGCPYENEGEDIGCKYALHRDALALLKAQEAGVLSVADIIDEHITPDVIWVERRRENDICAGVWQIDHYEMGQGDVLSDLGEEIAERPEAYNTLWRVWTSRPTDEQREAVPWMT